MRRRSLTHESVSETALTRLQCRAHRTRSAPTGGQLDNTDTDTQQVAVTFLRQSGIRIVIYLDDLLIVGSSAEDCSTSVALVIKTLQSLGFLINFKKSETTPVQIIEYIGLITNSISMSFHFTKKKVDNIKRLSRETLKKKKCSLRELAKIIGNVNWAIYPDEIRKIPLQSTPGLVQFGT